MTYHGIRSRAPFLSVTFAAIMPIMPRAKEQRAANFRRGEKGSSMVFVFKTTLNYCTPRVWRRIAVPRGYTFFDLHCAIQDAMGWADSHLHTFRVDTQRQPKSKRAGRDRGEIISIEFPNPEADKFPEHWHPKDERGSARDRPAPNHALPPAHAAPCLARSEKRPTRARIKTLPERPDVCCDLRVDITPKQGANNVDDSQPANL